MTNPKDNSYFANQELPVIYVFNPEAANQKYKSDYNTAEKFFKYMKKNYPASVAAQCEAYGDYDQADNTIKYEMMTADYASKYWKDGNDYAESSVLYSLYGFIRADKDNESVIQMNNNGVYTPFDVTIDQSANLPVVRYLLPIPREAITRSGGVYKNYYGY